MTTTTTTNDAVADELTPPASASTSGGGGGNTKFRNGKKKSRAAASAADEDNYDSVLTAFDEYAKGKGDSVGYEFEVGDMVWGKVKSHPWWPGHVYNEAFASPSVRRSKREGHVLVAFFGDSSYGWFDRSELIPFEENYEEKSSQTSARPFLVAVEEAVDELSRRRNLGLACRCRNEFNFWPCSVEGYFSVDVGDSDPGFFSGSQISKARDEFRPREMVSFLHNLAVTPMDDQQWTIDFIKNKATVLACRKAMFEEFDETYAQAFGTAPVRPPRPTMPVALDPSKATLNGRLVIAEAFGKGKISVKPKRKDQVEKDKYLLKRRDESSEMKPKKAAGSSTYPLLVDGSSFSGRSSHSALGDQVRGNSVSDITHNVSNTKPSEGSSSNNKVGSKKGKLHKRHAGELSSENAALVQKKKKKKENKDVSNESSGQLVKSPVSIENSVPNLDTSHVLLPAPRGDSKIQKDSVEDSTSAPADMQQKVAVRNSELSALLSNLRCLALDPFYGVEKGCPVITKQVFWKYRSLVYKKSLLLSPPPENEASDSRVSKPLAVATTLSSEPSSKSTDKSKMKVLKPPVRPDDPTKGGRKRPPSDRPEDGKKKMKLGDSENFKKKNKLTDSEDMKKKRMIDSKSVAGEKKMPQRFIESPRGDLKESVSKNVGGKEIVPKNVGSTISKPVKVESSKRTVQSAKSANPTMLTMKFPNNAGLPSGAELRAKFARFGPLDHSATRVFWKSYQCRLVYLYKADAEAALKFAVGSSNLFGNTNVRCYTRELEIEAAESETTSALPTRESAAEQRTTPKVNPSALQLQQSEQQQQQLKSCLKKPSGDESGNGGGRGGSRVKFVLGGDKSNIEVPIQQPIGYKNSQVTPSTEGASPSTNALDASSSKNLPYLIPRPSVTTTTATSIHAPLKTRLEKPAMNLHSFEQVSSSFIAPLTAPQLPVPPLLPPPPPPVDISQPMLSLLTRCSDVVSYVTGALGYVPYHPL